MKKFLICLLSFYLFCFFSYLYYMYTTGRFNGITTVLSGLWLTLDFMGRLVIYFFEKIIQVI